MNKSKIDLSDFRKALKPFGKLNRLEHNVSGDCLFIFIGSGFQNTTANIEQLFIVIDEYTKEHFSKVAECSVAPTHFLVTLIN